MNFRPCIDIHNGKVKQIVGASLRDAGNAAANNFVSEKDADYYAEIYRRDGLTGGHIIILNPENSEYYKSDCIQAEKALKAYPEGLQIGGGITAENAERFIRAGASHVIVTSYVFKNGVIDYENLDRLKSAVGKDRIVLDLSCRKRGDSYYIVTDRWQKYTQIQVTHEVLTKLAEHCSEYLIHAVDVEGRSAGIDEALAELIGSWKGIPVTYAGGVRKLEDLKKLRDAGEGRLNATIGSALDLFGGSLKYKDVVEYCRKTQ